MDLVVTLNTLLIRKNFFTNFMNLLVKYFASKHHMFSNDSDNV